MRHEIQLIRGEAATRTNEILVAPFSFYQIYEIVLDHLGLVNCEYLNVKI